MATERVNPYPQFNFSVDFGQGIRAGFQECSNIGMEMTVVEYRNGNDPTNNVRKITGLNKASDVTLKRGAIGVLDLIRLAQRHPQRHDERRSQCNDQSDERGQNKHHARFDVAAFERPHYQICRRSDECQRNGRGDGRIDAFIRTSGNGIKRFQVSSFRFQVKY